jgi:hypothetical protein
MIQPTGSTPEPAAPPSVIKWAVTSMDEVFGTRNVVLECQNLACRARTRIDKREAERLMNAGVSPA